MQTALSKALNYKSLYLTSYNRALCWALILVIGLGSLAWSEEGHKKYIMGYYPNWGQYSGFKAENIRYKLYTHILYSFYITNPNGDLFNADRTDQDNFDKMVELCEQNGVKLVVSIGGADQSEGFAELSKAPGTRKNLIDNMIQLVKKYENKIHGFDIDWEYPVTPLNPGSTRDDKEGHRILFKEIRAAFDQYKTETGHKIEFSAALPATDWWARHITDESLHQLDHLMLMTYDYMGTWEKNIRPNSGLVDPLNTFKYYEDRGLPKEKLVMGFAFYGKSFNAGSEMGGEYDGKGSGADGIQLWKRLLKQLKTTKYEVKWHEETKSEYAVGNGEIIVFDGIPSTQAKAQYMKDNQEYPGVMFWDMLSDFGVPPKHSLLVTLYETYYGEKAPVYDYDKLKFAK